MRTKHPALLAGPAGDPCGRVATFAACRPRRAVLHIGYHRPPLGGAAVPRQPRLQLDAIAAAGLLTSADRVADIVFTRKPLPRTRLGKLCRHLLAAAWQDARGGGTHPAKAEPLPPESWPEADRALLESPTSDLTWAWLVRRFSVRRLTPDTSLPLDLEVDSLAWLDIALDLEQATGVELGEAAIARIETVRDLLREMVEMTPGEVSAAAWDQSERVLTAADRRWLAPIGPFARGFA